MTVLTSNRRKKSNLVMPNFPIEKIFFKSNDGVLKELPNWAAFYIKLGTTLATFNHDEIKLVIALATPTRSYAAAFIAAGINYARSFIPQEKTDEEYSNFIFSLDEGTPVIYRDMDRKKFGVVEKLISSPDGKKYLGLQLEKGQWVYITADKARLVTVDERENIQLPKHQHGRQITTSSRFLNNIFTSNTNEFALETRLECAIVGPLVNISNELEINLIFQSDSDCNLGTLSELIRLYKPFPKGTAFRTCIHSTSARKKPKLPVQEDPFFVIFDGSSGFLKWKDAWEGLNWAVILDRTDRNLMYAAQHINLEFLNRTEKNIKLPLPEIPSGIDVTLFGVLK